MLRAQFCNSKKHAQALIKQGAVRVGYRTIFNCIPGKIVSGVDEFVDDYGTEIIAELDPVRDIFWEIELDAELDEDWFLLVGKRQMASFADIIAASCDMSWHKVVKTTYTFSDAQENHITAVREELYWLQSCIDTTRCDLI
jgi:hypothetical protein